MCLTVMTSAEVGGPMVEAKGDFGGQVEVQGKYRPVGETEG